LILIVIHFKMNFLVQVNVIYIIYCRKIFSVQLIKYSPHRLYLGQKLQISISATLCIVLHRVVFLMISSSEENYEIYFVFHVS